MVAASCSPGFSGHPGKPKKTCGRKCLRHFARTAFGFARTTSVAYRKSPGTLRWIPGSVPGRFPEAVPGPFAVVQFCTTAKVTRPAPEAQTRSVRVHGAPSPTRRHSRSIHEGSPTNYRPSGDVGARAKLCSHNGTAWILEAFCRLVHFSPSSQRGSHGLPKQPSGRTLSPDGFSPLRNAKLFVGP